MRRALLAAALAACLPVLASQPADVARHKCEPVPKLPPKRMMQEASVAKAFDRDMKAYTECINAYLAARNAAIKANTEAANEAINEYNGVMKAIKEAREQG